ncbi:glycosyltransferase family 4 protein [Patescibacteria group bacterium]|nr:glycosyltransferase family 4 protein [Patescibacteria group bacterium]MBU1673234.1 glycosyltransferase family 4 protein [Patescibacteria group bacterium]MBU1964008.1 glycosyltransferase family 4 protein [Patescibacteria group bacterium]
MRIAVISEVWPPAIEGGAEIHIKETCIRIAASGNFDFNIITRKLIDANDVKFTNLGHDGKLLITRCGLTTKFSNILGRLWYIPSSILKIIKYKPDIIHAHSFIPGIIAKLTRIFIKKPILLTVHGTTQFTSPKSIRAKIEKWLEKIITTKFEYNQEISVAQNFLKLPNKNKDIAIVPNGVDIQIFDDVQAGKYDKFTLIFVGRFDYVKGLDLLIEAIKELKDQDLQLNLIGNGYEEKNLKALVEKNKLENKINFLGRLSGGDLITEIKKSHALILPSRSEGFPLTILEAWAAKIPVIATDVGENSYLITKGNGFLIKPNSISEIQSGIVKAVENSDRLEEMGKNGYNLVVEKFSWDKSAQSLKVIYEQSI